MEMITIMAGESPAFLALVDCRDVLRRIRPCGYVHRRGGALDHCVCWRRYASLQRFFLRGAYDGRACDGDFRPYLSLALASLLEDTPSFPKIESYLRSPLTEEGKPGQCFARSSSHPSDYSVRRSVASRVCYSASSTRL